MKNKYLYAGLIVYIIFSIIIFISGMISDDYPISLIVFSPAFGPTSFLIVFGWSRGGSEINFVGYLLTTGIIFLPYYFIFNSKRKMYRIINLFLCVVFWIVIGFMNLFYDMMVRIG